MIVSLGFVVFIAGLGNTFGQSRRMDYFLTDSYLNGEDNIIELMFENMENDQGEEPRQVLAGNFLPMDDESEEQVEEPPPETIGNGTEAEEKPSLLKGEAYLKALQTLPMPLQQIVGHYRDSFEVEILAMMDVLKDPGTDDELQMQLDCNAKKESCLAVDNFGVRCMIDCLTKDNPRVNKYAGYLAQTLRSICSTIGTPYADVFETMEKDSQGIRMESYIRAVEGKSDDLVPVAIKGANSLLYLLVTGATTSLLPMGVVAEEIKGLLANNPQPATNETSSKTTNPMEFGNPACIPRILADESFRIAQVVNREPCLLDVALPGYSILSSLVKYVPGDHQEFFSGYVEAFEIVTGVQCGVVNSAEGGDIEKCNPLGGFPRPGTPLPEALRNMPDWKTHCRGGPPSPPVQ